MLLIILGIGRPAIDAAKIAPVSDRKPQVGDLAAEFVVKRHSIRRMGLVPRKAKPDPQRGSGANRRIQVPANALLSRPTATFGSWCDSSASARIACGRLGRFRLNPHPGRPGTPR